MRNAGRCQLCSSTKLTVQYAGVVVLVGKHERTLVRAAGPAVASGAESTRPVSTRRRDNQSETSFQNLAPVQAATRGSRQESGKIG